MPYSFQNGKALYNPYEYNRLGVSMSSQEYPKYVASYAAPLTINEDKTQVCVRVDCVQVRLSIVGAPKNGVLFNVADQFKPAAPVLFMVVRDSDPFTPVGTAFLGTDGRFQIFQSAAGNVQIYGSYMVKAHE